MCSKSGFDLKVILKWLVEIHENRFLIKFWPNPEKESSTRQSKLGYNWFQVALQLKQKILLVLLLQNERKKV
jgi:hypothetical protein